MLDFPLMFLQINTQREHSSLPVVFRSLVNVLEEILVMFVELLRLANHAFELLLFVHDLFKTFIFEFSILYVLDVILVVEMGSVGLHSEVSLAILRSDCDRKDFFDRKEITFGEVSIFAFVKWNIVGL